MKLSIYMVLYLIPAIEPENLTGAGKSEYRYAALFRPDEPEFPKDIIYVASAEQLSECPAERLQGLTITVFGDPETVPDSVLLENLMLRFPEQYTQADIMNSFQEAFARANNWEREADIAIYKDKTLQGLMSTVEMLMDDLVLVWNPAFEILATANAHNENIPELLRNTVENRVWQGDIIEHMLREHDYLTKPVRYTSPQIITPPNITGCHSCVKIFMLSGKIIIIFGIYFLDGYPHRGKLDFLSALFGRIQQHLEFYALSYRGSRKIYESFLLGLLNGELNKEQDIRDRLQYLSRFSFWGDFEVIVVCIDKSSQMVAMNTGLNHCKQMFPHAKFVELDTYLVGLDNWEHDTKRRGAQRAIAPPEYISVGVSRRYACLKDTAQAYRQALAALKYGETVDPEVRYYLYEEYYIYQMLSRAVNLPNGEFDLPDARYIYRLRELDSKKKGMGNEKLFCAYLQTGQNTAKTAELMNLHRNSVLYRIKQIEDYLGIDLSRMDTVFHRLYRRLPHCETLEGSARVQNIRRNGRNNGTHGRPRTDKAGSKKRMT